MSLRWLWLVLLVTVACPKPVPPLAPPPPPPVVVPDGCMQNLSGEWTHHDDPSFHYLVEDDGGTAWITVTQVVIVDAGFRPRKFARDGTDSGVPDAGAVAPPDAGPVDGGAEDAGQGDAGRADASAATAVDAGRDGGLSVEVPHIELVRTSQGFIGRTVATAHHPSGRVCLVEYRTELINCTDGGLTLRSATATSLSDTCEPPPHSTLEPTRDHRLDRASPK